MNMSKNMEKIKATLLFVVKSVIFLYVSHRYLLMFYTFPLFIFIFGSEILPVWLSFVVLLFIFWLPYCTYMFSMYFMAKKMGIIKVLDNLPLKYLILILFIFELILTLHTPININHENFHDYIMRYWKLIIRNTLHDFISGFGFIYTYITYKIIKFLIRKYPKKFSWLDKLYPKKLEEIISFKNFKNIFRKIFNKDKCS